MLYTKLKEKLMGGNTSNHYMGRLHYGRSPFLSEKISLEASRVMISYYESTITDDITKTEYNIVLSDEMKQLLKLTGEKEGDVILKDIDENSVMAYPKYDTDLAGYKTWMGFEFYHIMYEGKVVKNFVHNTRGACYCIHRIKNPVGIYKGEYLVAECGEEYVLVDKYGHMVTLDYIPQPESGRDDHKEVYMEANKLFVEEYVYYDCDHHHGGWEARITDMDEKIALIPYVVGKDLIKEICEKYKSSSHYLRAVYYSKWAKPVWEDGKLELEFTIHVYKKKMRGPDECCDFKQVVEIIVPDDKSTLKLGFEQEDGKTNIYDIISNPLQNALGISELVMKHYSYLIN